MSSLADLPELVGFFSYSREDDANDRGELSALRDCIERELGTQLGRSKEKFGVWQDKEEIRYGTLWEERIKTAVARSAFFIPIITPRVVKSPYCRFELDLFLAREAMFGRSDLVFPILYIRVPGLENSAQRQNDPVLSVIAKRQYRDWRKFRHQDIHSTDVRQAVADFCEHIADALNVPWLSPEESKEQEEAETRERAEEERQRQEAEAKRREEDARRKAAEEAQARERAEQERRRQEEEAKRVAEEESRRRTAAEAGRQRRERDAAVEREAEERRKEEEDERRHTEEERRRLKPGPAWPRSRRALVSAGVLFVAVVGSAGVWFADTRRTPGLVETPPVQSLPAPVSPDAPMPPQAASAQSPATSIQPPRDLLPVAAPSGAVPLSPDRERVLKPKDSFKECANCPEMVVVPAGSFTMGSPGTEEGRSNDEGPQHT